MRVVADLLPKEANINVEASEAFVELWRRISDGLGDDWRTAWMRSKNGLFCSSLTYSVRRQSHGRQQL